MSEKIVKSVGRVFEILELFKTKQMAMNIADIANALDYPHSSTLAILKSMESMGYLANTPTKYSYFPTYKLYGLIDWLSESTEHETSILSFMKDLYDQSGETINLCKRTGDYVKILAGHLGNHAITINVREGTLMPSNSSFMGLTCLAVLTDKEVGEILNGLKEQNLPSSLDDKQVRDLISNIRQDKITSGYDIFIRGIGAISIPILSENKNDVLIVGLIGPTDRLKSEEDNHKILINELIQKHNLTIAVY